MGGDWGHRALRPGLGMNIETNCFVGTASGARQPPAQPSLSQSTAGENILCRRCDSQLGPGLQVDTRPNYGR